MHRNILKKNWYELFNDLKERYPDLTQSDLDYIGGDEQRLIEVVGKRRHITPEDAGRDVHEFLDTLRFRKRPPE